MLLRSTHQPSRPSPTLSRLFALAGMMGYACAFPEYIFEEATFETCQNGILDGDEERVDCGGSCEACPGSDCEPNDPECQPSTCNNNVQDEGEGGVDCGGSCALLCPGQKCSHDKACASEVCDGVCLEATCEDDQTNGDETGFNCGGSCPGCGPGLPCEGNSDCESKVCLAGECQQATCDDKVQNGGESDVDCGAELCPCDLGRTCQDGDNCQSGYCDEVELTCVAPHCTNDRVDPDEDETDVDCGGECAGCETGQMCEGIDSNCRSGVCGIDHTCLAASCSDGTQNGDETDVDCGGDPQCADCKPGQKCKSNDDCREHVCTEGECAEPSCDDTFDNGNETDVDCGGDCEPCAAERGCLEDADCQSSHCVGICVEASCTDGIQNDNEVAIDCGGGCPLCGLGSPCGEDAHCASNLCENACEVGLQVRQNCTRCGADTDAIGFQVELTNLGTSDFPISELELRYYFSAELDTAFVPVCLGCEFDVSVDEYAASTDDASHYVAIDFSSATEPLAPEGMVTAQVVVDWTESGYMDQTNDYSFRSSGLGASNATTLYRNGILIWGIEPASND